MRHQLLLEDHQSVKDSFLLAQRLLVFQCNGMFASECCQMACSKMQVHMLRGTLNLRVAAQMLCEEGPQCRVLLPLDMERLGPMCQSPKHLMGALLKDGPKVVLMSEDVLD